MLGLCVVRLERLVRYGPRWRHTTVMAQLTKVLATKSEERGAIELSVATHAVVGVRVECTAGGVAPRLFRAVAPLDVHGSCVPVLLRAWHLVATLAPKES